MSGRLENKVVILTGATEGIGRAIAFAFVREGAKLLMVARRADPGEHLARELGDAVAFLGGNVADPRTAERAVGEAVARFGAVDVLVNNAGIDLASTPIVNTSVEQARELFEVNTLGSLWFMQACFPEMVTQGGGSVINITSRLGLIGLSGSAVYGASKGALHTLTRGAAVEWADYGIRVNAIAPGLTETAMVTDWIATQDNPELFRQELQKSIPLGRFTTPDEVAMAAIYLASGESASTTGASLSIDGGYTAA